MTAQILALLSFNVGVLILSRSSFRMFAQKAVQKVCSFMYCSHSGNAVPYGYRPDIDGLRAIAVLAVVVFHAFPARFSGGFVGVDVFFVISGFLITGIIYKGLIAKEFSFLDFWARRIRRIFPALLTVIVATFITGWWYLLPSEFEVLKSHIEWGLAFAANIKLHGEVGYFDTTAELKPLLHLWSLAIEEQFYLVWPALLWVSFRRRLNLFMVTLILAVLSYESRKVFGVTENGAFYFPWTRFWELQVGALLALWNTDYAPSLAEFSARAKRLVQPLVFRKDIASTKHAPIIFFQSALSIVGIALIAYACWKFNKATPFPSRHTLYPVFGAALIIAAGKDAWFNRRILSLSPMRLIGQISFPLYLWHWPMLAFARIILGEPSPTFALCTISISIVLSIATYLTIETFLRFERCRIAWRAPTLATTLCALILLVKYGNLSISNNNGGEDSISNMKPPAPLQYGACPPYLLAQGRQSLGYCATSHGGESPSVVIVGDSHAKHLFHGFSKLSPSETVLLVGQHSCPPILTNEFYTTDCITKNRFILDYLKSPNGKSVHTVILSYFGWYPAETPYAFEHASPGKWAEVTINGSNSSQIKMPAFEHGLERFALELANAGKTVFIVEDIPEIPFITAPCLATVPHREILKRFLGISPLCSVPRSAYQKRLDLIQPMLRRIAQKHQSIKIISAGRPICSETHCNILSRGALIYHDGSHLNLIGSELVAGSLLKQIRESGAANTSLDS